MSSLTNMRVATVDELRRHVAAASLANRSTVELVGDFEAHPHRAALEQRLNADLKACGCHESAVGLMVGSLIAPLTMLVMRVAGNPTVGWEGIVWSMLALSFAGAAIGKLLGIVRALRRVRAIADEIDAAAPGLL